MSTAKGTQCHGWAMEAMKMRKQEFSKSWSAKPVVIHKELLGSQSPRKLKPGTQVEGLNQNVKHGDVDGEEDMETQQNQKDHCCWGKTIHTKKSYWSAWISRTSPEHQQHQREQCSSTFFLFCKTGWKTIIRFMSLLYPSFIISGTDGPFKRKRSSQITILCFVQQGKPKIKCIYFTLWIAWIMIWILMFIHKTWVGNILLL